MLFYNLISLFEPPFLQKRNNVEIYQNKSAADDTARASKRISCKDVDHFSIDYDPTTSTNPLALAYADLKTNSKMPTFRFPR